MSADQHINVDFVSIIQQFPVLYNPNLLECSKKEIEKAWTQISEKFKAKVSDCKNRWKNLRSNYVKRYKEVQLQNDPKIRTPFYLEEELSFLIPFIKNGKRFSNPVEKTASGVTETSPELSGSTSDEVEDTSAMHLGQSIDCNQSSGQTSNGVDTGETADKAEVSPELSIGTSDYTGRNRTSPVRSSPSMKHNQSFTPLQRAGGTKRKRKVNFAATTGGTKRKLKVNVPTTTSGERKEKNGKEDENTLFCQSLIPVMNEMSRKQRHSCKIKILESMAPFIPE